MAALGAITLSFGAGVSGCSRPPDYDVVGSWEAQEVPVVRLEFYPDGVVSISGVGVLGLQWKQLNTGLVRLETSTRVVYADFDLSRDEKGRVGVLTLAGFQTFHFRPLSSAGMSR